MNLFPFYLLIALIGGSIGTIELLLRYRESPPFFKIPQFWVYIIFNSLPGVLTFWLMQIYALDFGFDPALEASKIVWTQTLIAGFGSLIFLRSSLFIARVGDQDIPVGPISLLVVILDSMDREVDRRRAARRVETTRRIMKEIPYEVAAETLPLFATALMQNLPKSDQEQILVEIKGVSQNETLTNDTKSQLIGLILINYVGEDVLEGAAEALKKSGKGQIAPENDEEGLGNLIRSLQEKREDENNQE